VRAVSTVLGVFGLGLAIANPQTAKRLRAVNLRFIFLLLFSERLPLTFFVCLFIADFN
jgi:hypothetical protein